MNTKIQLATTQVITTTYAGEFAAKYIAAALLSADSLVNGAIEIRQNIKFKEVISKLDLTNIIKDRSCDFADTGTVTLGEQILQPKELSVQLELCKGNYRNTWEAINMGFSANDSLAPDFSNFLIEQVLAGVAAETETAIWQGTATAGSFAGFEVLFTAQATQPSGQEVGGTTVTDANVVAEIGKVLAAVPTAVYGKEDLNILIPTNIAKHYIAAQAALGYRDLFNDGVTRMNFQGVNLITCPGMSDDVMFGVRRSDFFFGTGLLNDMNSVSIVDRSATELDDNVRIGVNYTAGVQVGNAENVVTYGITNGSN